MVNYLDAKNTLFTRGVSFDIKQYLFVLQVVLGEDKAVAYGMIYDKKNFVKETGEEDENEYLAKIKGEAEVMLQQQECQHLFDLLKESYQADVQASASTLQDYKFSGAEIQQLLSNLLHNRSESLDDASVKDILSLIKTMYEQGALDSGDTFQKHFITVHNKFNALCTSCNREFDAIEGVDCVCPHCKQVYRWSEEDNRFYPKPSKL